jgi:hypothetical protein
MLSKTKLPSSGDEGNPEFEGALAGDLGAENRQAPAKRQATHTDWPVTVDEINDAIADANQAIERAADATDDANSAIEAVNTLIEAWSAQHPNAWGIDPIDELDVPETIDEVYADEDDEEGDADDGGVS